MPTAGFEKTRGRLEAYFDRTAADAWAALTSDAPVSRIRATVRAGRDEMRSTLLSWLPADLSGARVLDAGCGSGALAIEAARRGADVVAVDVAASAVSLAEERAADALRGAPGRVAFHAGDMLDPRFGRFDAAVCMDSLIHYGPADIAAALAALGPRVDGQILFTYAPRTPALAVMHAAGRLFPRRDRAPFIAPIGAAALARRIAAEPALAAFARGRERRVSSGFYVSAALELTRGAAA